MRLLAGILPFLSFMCINADKHHDLPSIFDGLDAGSFCYERETGYYCNVLDKRYIYSCPSGSKTLIKEKGFFCAANGAVPDYYKGEKGFDVQKFCSKRAPGIYVGPKDSRSIALWKCPECLPLEYCKPKHYPYQLNDTFAICKEGLWQESESRVYEELKHDTDTEHDEEHVKDIADSEHVPCNEPCECKKDIPCHCLKPTEHKPCVTFVHAIPTCASWTTVTPCRDCHHNHERFGKPTRICVSTTYCNVKCTDIKKDENGCYCNGWRYEPNGCQCREKEGPLY